MVKMYGIPNCGTVKKALDYFKAKNIKIEFHNYKTDGISEEKLQEWFSNLDFNKVVNKKSSTYRTLSDAQKEALNAPETAIPILQEFTSIIKRPLVESSNLYLVGFSEEDYNPHFH